MSTPRLLTEIETAHLAGFRRFRDFRRALRAGRFPQPDVELPDGPRWSETLLRNWLDGRPDPRTLEDEERALIERLTKRAREAQTSRRQDHPRR